MHIFHKRQGQMYKDSPIGWYLYKLKLYFSIRKRSYRLVSPPAETILLFPTCFMYHQPKPKVLSLQL